MSRNQAIYSHMDFPVTNEAIKYFNFVCCSWGQRKLPYDLQGNIRGRE
jgi:ribosomal protein S6